MLRGVLFEPVPGGVFSEHSQRLTNANRKHFDRFENQGKEKIMLGSRVSIPSPGPGLVHDGRIASDRIGL